MQELSLPSALANSGVVVGNVVVNGAPRHWNLWMGTITVSVSLFALRSATTYLVIFHPGKGILSLGTVRVAFITLSQSGNRPCLLVGSLFIHQLCAYLLSHSLSSVHQCTVHESTVQTTTVMGNVRISLFTLVIWASVWLVSRHLCRWSAIRACRTARWLFARLAKWSLTEWDPPWVSCRA